MLPLLLPLIEPLLAGAGVRALAGMASSSLARTSGGTASRGLGEVTETLLGKTKPVASKQSQPPAQSSLRGGLLGNVSSLLKLGGGDSQRQQQQPQPQEPRTGKGFSSLAARGSNFGDLLSGKKSQEDVEGEAKADEAKQKAEQMAIDRLKKFNLGLGLIAGTGAALYKLPGLLGSFGKSLLAGQETLRKFNGQIANAFARLERQQLQLQFRTAGATAGSTQTLVDEQMRFNESQQEINETLKTIWNGIATGVTWVGRIGNEAIKWTPLFAALKWLAKKIERNTDKNTGGPPWKQFVADLGARQFAGKEADKLNGRKK